MTDDFNIPPRTVGQEIERVLPLGTIKPKQLKAGNAKYNTTHGKWDVVPLFPPDLFAVVGHLCNTGSVVGYFSPDPNLPKAAPDNWFSLSEDEKDELKADGKRWRKGAPPVPGKLVSDLWRELRGFGDQPVRAMNGEKGKWWVAALKLLIIADVASKGLGRHTNKDVEKNKFNRVMDGYFGNSNREAKTGGNTVPDSRKPATLSALADSDIVCVLPKSRIAQVGCTLRNITANLSLLPPRGMVRCHWSQPLKHPKKDNDSALDILLVPVPFTLAGLNFRPAGTKSGKRRKVNWGNFHVEQDWIADKQMEDELVEFTKSLLKAAKRDVRTVNVVVFPEYALNFRTFDKLCMELPKIEPSLEIIIAGSSSNCDGPETEEEKEKANFVLTAVNYDKYEKNGKLRYDLTSRRKHHRWRLDQHQIADYALSSSLNPTVQAWWESHHISKRELHFHQFRRSSTFVSMICEDLARNDPCHEIVRSVGPNLLFALLMDGPQLKHRWSARYASSLADDPGCSVLTFTSFGLVDRLNKTKKYDENRSIALWKDETGQMVEILMPKEGKDCGVLISLCSKDVYDQTIDGRKTKNCSWQFQSQMPVTLSKKKTGGTRKKTLGFGFRPSRIGRDHV